MTGPAPSARTRMMVEAYGAGGSLSRVAWIFGVSKHRVSLAVKRHAPGSMRAPHVSHGANSHRAREPRHA